MVFTTDRGQVSVHKTYLVNRQTIKFCGMENHYLCAGLSTSNSFPISTGSSCTLTPPASMLAVSSVYGSFSLASSSTTSFDMARFPIGRLFGDNQAFVQAWHRFCDSEGSCSSLETHSVTVSCNSERPTELPSKLGNTLQRRGIKASKSESHLLHRERPYPPRNALEKYSMGSGNPYGCGGQHPRNKPLV